MRLFLLVSVLTAVSLLFASPFAAASLAQRQVGSSFGGYLATLMENNGPNIFQYLSRGNDPTSFRPLNNGAPILFPGTLGTQAARDPYLVYNGKEYFIIATDSNIYIPANWALALRRGSRSLFVWRSTDLINWSAPRLVRVEGETAGMAWAPSAIWNERERNFDVFWASRLYSPEDEEHTGNSTLNMIRTARTTDFRSFTSPRTYINPAEHDRIPLIDQEFQKIPGGWVRFLKDESRMRIIQEISYSPTVFGNDWTRVEDLVVDLEREGPASFADNLEPGRYHLWLVSSTREVP